MEGLIMKRSKKRYDWTEKNLRKTRSKHQRGYWKPPSKTFKTYFNEGFKASNKQVLYSEVNLSGSGNYVTDKVRISRSRWFWW